MTRSHFQGRMITTVAVISLAFGGCAEDASGPASISGSRGVTQGGAQDIGLFRSIVSDGDVPASDTLDPVGFFAEHAIDLPEADCGQSVCVHPFLAVAPRFDGSNWTMAFVALNSPVDPAELERPPVHMVAVVERTGRTWQFQEALLEGLRDLVAELRPEDRLSIVGYSRTAGVFLEAGARAPATFEAIERLGGGYPDSEAGLYDGLALAGRLATETEFDGTSRILLLSSGHADVGIQTPERIVSLAEGYARQGVSFGVIAYGDDIDDRALRGIGNSGAATYAVAEHGAALIQILRNEAETAMFPLATDFDLQIQAAEGYRVGRIYGARRAVAQSTHARLSNPALFLGHRTGADDTAGGRRGGGGGLFVELLVEEDAPRSTGLPAFDVVATYQDASGQPVRIEHTVLNSLAPGQNPVEMRPEFSDEARGKAFMMLNMYLALRTTLQTYEEGDCARALGTVDLFAPTVDLWQAIYPDEDIRADLQLLVDVRSNIEAACESGTSPIQPQELSMGCFFL